MKSLYESILSKAGIGLEEKVKQFFINSLHYSSGRTHYDVSKGLEIKFSGKGIDVKLGQFMGSYIAIDGRDLVNGDFPFKLNSVKDDMGEEIDLVMRECNISSFKNFPEHKKIRFLGCSIDDLSDLPKSYKELEFRRSNSLSGGRANYIGKCQGLKLDLWSAEGDSYSIAINRFKNNTIKDFCLATCSWNNHVDMGGVVKEIIDTNNIKPEDITVMFFNGDKRAKRNRARVEKKKDGYVLVLDPKKHPELSNGYYE